MTEHGCFHTGVENYPSTALLLTAIPAPLWSTTKIGFFLNQGLQCTVTYSTPKNLHTSQGKSNILFLKEQNAQHHLFEVQIFPPKHLRYQACLVI